MPSVKGELSDMVEALSMREAGKVRGAIKQFVRQFPQLKFHVFLTSVASEFPIAKFAFWLFNGGCICSDLHKGGLNFHNLLLIDVEHRRSNLSIGYGLEPFLQDEDLTTILSAGQTLISKGTYGEAILAILDKATSILHERSDQIPKTFGLRPKTRHEEGL